MTDVHRDEGSDAGTGNPFRTSQREPRTETGSSADRPTTVRYSLLAGLALAAASAYLTRTCIAVANTTIQKELNFSNERMGLILGAFAAGYMWLQIPGGWLADRFGPRAVLSGLSVAWSLCTVWTGLAWSFSGLFLSRQLYGAFQAGLVPCSAKFLSSWVPVSQRGIAGALIGSSMSAGAIVATGLTAQLLPIFGWRTVILMYSGVGICWSAWFFLRFRDRPELDPLANEAERRLIRAGPAHAGTVSEGSPPLHEPAHGRSSLAMMILTSGSMWAICSQGFFRAFGYEFFVTQFPAYLEKGHALKVTQAGLLTMLPLAGVVTGSLMGGWLVDFLLRKTGSKWISRSLTGAMSLGLCGVFTLAAAWARQPLLAVMIISCGSFLASFAGPATWAATMDVSGKHTAVMFGIMNMVGNAGSLACPITVGYLFSYIEANDASWDLVLYLFAAVYAAGALCWLVLNPERSAVEPRLAAPGLP